MQSFLGDAGKGGNALKQVSQREGVDNSLFRDRYAPQAGSSSQSSSFRQGPRAVQHNAPSPSGQLSHPPHPFNLSHLSAALADPTVAGPVIRPPNVIPDHFEQSWGQSRPNQSSRSSPAPAFVSEYNARPAPLVQGSGWAESFSAGKGKGRAEPVAQHQQQQQQQFHQTEYNGQIQGYGYQPRMPFQPSLTPMYGGLGNYSQQYAQQPMMSQRQDQSQVGEQTESLDQAFEKAMADWKAMDEAHKEAQQQDSKVSERSEEVQGEVRDGIEDKGESKGELEKIWESLKPEAERLDKLAEWEADFSQFTNDEDDLFESLNESLNRPDVGQTPLEEQMRVEEAIPETQYQAPSVRPRAYEYTLPNRFDSMDPQEAWNEANRLLNSGGSLADATLLLESHLRRGAAGTPEELRAWSLLGKTHAMNEKEEKALSAFEEGRQSIQGSEGLAYVGDMLTNLAISYVNESADFEALQVLHQFLAQVHPEHAGQAPQQESLESRSNPWTLHQEFAEKYLNLAREQYNSRQVVDPDVQVGLGTLYYMMGEYTEARDCWVAALAERPDDYLLWNRLGATLANGGNPEEAVDAYRRALEIKPLFTRATFNLGVACLNIGVHKEAAEHILAALSLHSKDAEKEQRDSTPMWLTLRRALIALDMLELSGQARPGADLQTFREAGFDF